MLKRIWFFMSIFAFFVCTACNFTSQKKDKNNLVVSEKNQAFSVDLLETEPGERVKFSLFNKLKDESLKFFLLKEGEDPILVQHIKAQQGVIPKEYVFFKSKEVSPNQKLDVVFKAPIEEGEYAYVGVSGHPKEGLTGRLIVKKKVEEIKTL